ncbi:RNA-binding protein Musashi-like protein Rbp6 [Ooceraea biroi]|uniref:RNA-binding protein Musashi-like protein Rbp6 n=1 Tax=Ooceraea biroi TaxID=2015173 RepID=A0A026W0Y5_OOCBI|nr:RNA-binding protein Musashi-like protein Rbp6 [Ooceraea biroi]
MRHINSRFPSDSTASIRESIARARASSDGRGQRGTIDPKVAFPRRTHPKTVRAIAWEARAELEQGTVRTGQRDSDVPSYMVTRTKKIFVGGLSAPTTLEDVKNYFEQFGPRSSVRREPMPLIIDSGHRDTPGRPLQMQLADIEIYWKTWSIPAGGGCMFGSQVTRCSLDGSSGR